MEVSPLQAHMPPSAVHPNGGTLWPLAALEQQHAVTSGSGAMLVRPPPPPTGVLKSPCIAPNQAYPAALAEHRAVVTSKELFLDTLTKFHLALGTRIVIPKMGGKDLDLHVLYAEVTQRGGLQQVIKDRKWKEITGAFDFPCTTTSASFVLRKYYSTLLHHYEQLYFFGSRGLLVSPHAAPLATSSPVPDKRNESAPAPEAHAEEPEVINSEGKKLRKRRLAPLPVMAPGDSIASVGSVVSGSIEGKFEHGYLVTVEVGCERLKGVIYHIPPGHVPGPQHADIPSFMLSTRVLGGAKLPEPAKGRKRNRREELKKDPNAPRSSRTGYNFFFVEERAKLKLKYPEKERELSRMVGDAWNGLTEEQKLPYQERGAKDKDRYEKEMREYRLLKSSTNAATPQEFTPPQSANAEDRDHQVESTSSVPVIPRQLILDPSQQQLVNSTQPEQQCIQQDLQQQMGSSHQSKIESPSLPAAAHVNENVGEEGNAANSFTQPVAHQFMI